MPSDETGAQIVYLFEALKDALSPDDECDCCGKRKPAVGDDGCGGRQCPECMSEGGGDGE